MNTSLRLAALALTASLAASAAAADPPWMDSVGDALGKKGSAQPGDVYRVGLPRTDLKVMLDGVEIKPALALGSWLAFTKHGDGGMAMGDLVLLPTEVNPVMKKLEENGMEITALHNHLLRNEPFTMYMHVIGHGDPVKLAAVLHDALAESGTPMKNPAPGTSAGATSAQIDLDTEAIDRSLGHKGSISGGVYQVNIVRTEKIKDGGMDVPEAMGSAIGINFQPTGGGKAAVTGDFVLIGQEVNPVLKALRENGIEVTALHNHMLDDQPRLYFMHFWANDDLNKLLAGLETALAKVNTARH
jgi:biotin operon repressor